MNEPERQDMEIERLLERVHLPEPSPALHDRIATAARQAWDREPTDVPWQIPLRRLALSAAAAVVIVSLANFGSDLLVSSTHLARPFEANSESTRNASDAIGVDDIRLRMATVRLQRPQLDLTALRERMERLHRTLEKTSPNGTERPPAPPGDRSRLLPTGPGLRIHS